jgi:chaperonin GroEL (HSP60 family)
MFILTPLSYPVGVPLGEACTIVLRGASTHILDEAERSLHDALCVLQATVRVSKHSGWVPDSHAADIA